MVNFDDLPPEIVLQVIENFGTAREISQFSRLNRRFHTLTEKDGYQVFLRHAFPYTPIPIPTEYAGDNGPFFKDATHSLTTLSKNWDKKAIMARQILPFSTSPSHRFGFRSRQTMGFHPALDSREEWHGSDWRDRYQILACGAGAQLYLQINDLTKDIYPSRQTPGGSHQARFAIYDEKETLDGRDDISAVKLLPQTISGLQTIVVGRCNGDVALITFNKRRNKFRRQMTLQNDQQQVKSIALNSHGILAIATFGRALSFYKLDEESQEPQLIHSMSLPQFHHTTGTQSLVWLNETMLAVGSSFAPYPVEVFDIEGQSLRQFAVDLDERGPSDAAYSLAALHDLGDFRGQSFLSGSYCGRVRRHDMRSPDTSVATFEDHIDYSTIYSLVTYGHERFVAGGATGLLKVFDLRAGRTKLQRRSRLAEMNSLNPVKDDHSTASGYNVFLHDHIRGRQSPIYTLSKPSDISPTLFAGTEGTVFQLEVNSTTDRFPDPVYGTMPEINHGGSATRMKWGSKRRILQLSAYEHPKNTSQSVKLRKQSPLGNEGTNLRGWDGRWT